MSAGVTPRMIARLDDLVAQRASQVLDAAAEKRDVNFVRDVAYALPMHMISDIVGISEADRARRLRLDRHDRAGRRSALGHLSGGGNKTPNDPSSPTGVARRAETKPSHRRCVEHRPGRGAVSPGEQ